MGTKFREPSKPGGWLQWEEPQNPAFARNTGTNQQGEPIEYPTVDKLMGFEPKGGWFRDFDIWMRQNSTLEELEKIDVPISLSTAKLENDTARRTCRDGNDLLQKVTELDDSERARLRYEFIDQFDKIQMEGDLAVYRVFVGLARAPST